MKKYADAGNAVVIGITFALFVAALFLKGFTKDLVLEAGVLLVSVKIILMNYKLGTANQDLLRKLEAIEASVRDGRKDGDAPGERSGQRA